MSDSTQNNIHTPASQPVFSSRKFIWPILGILLLGMILVALDREKILAALRQADWRAIPPALIFTALSYLCISYTYAIVARVWGIGMPRRDLTEICFVTTSLNHVVRSGGIAGFSVRYMLMHQHGIPFNDVISSSIVHHYLTSLDMLAMLPVAMAYVAVNTELSPRVSLLLSMMTALFVVVAFIGTMLVFSDRLRRQIIGIGAWLGRLVLRRDFSAFLNDFNRHMNYGIRMLRQHGGRFVQVMALTFADYAASITVLGFCFMAFGPGLKPGALIACFMIGIMAGVISALPGGIGVQEGSMTGVAMLFSASFEQAILAALLFRVVYFFIPYLISPIFYWRLLHQPASNAAD